MPIKILAAVVAVVMMLCFLAPPVLKLKEILAARQIIAEVDGVLLVIPFDNVKYIEAHPAPAKLPEYIIRGASIPS